MSEPDAAARFRTLVSADLLAARRARDTTRVAAYRTMLGLVDNAGAVPATQAWDADRPALGETEVPRRHLATGDVVALVRAEIDRHRDAVDHYRAADQDGAAADLEAETAVMVETVDRFVAGA